MQSKLAVLVLSLALVPPMGAEDAFKLTTVVPGRSTPVVLYVFYSGPLPASATSYNLKSDWKAEWQTKQTVPPTIVNIDQVDVDVANKSFTLHLSGNLPKVLDMLTVSWTVLLLSDQIPFTTVTSTPAHKTCTAYLCPPDSTPTPDLSFSGSFTAAGGSNPLYQFEVKGGLILPRIRGIPGYPALNMQIEINQNPKPPIHRTRFDPDSITGGFALTKYINTGGPLSGMRFQAELPEGEFSRKDPSSNIIAAGIATLDFKPLLSPNASFPLYFTLYPFFGMEMGRNLSRPKVVEMIPVDLSNYRGIVRGYMGADAKFALATADRKSDVFSITGTYRVRIPAINEPFLETIHQVTTFAMTTKARHWVESDVAYTIPSWKYLSISGTYQYGELPPFFELVDHKFTIGLKLQAVQATKPAGYKLVQ